MPSFPRRTPSRTRRISAISLSVIATPSAGLTGPVAARIKPTGYLTNWYMTDGLGPPQHDLRGPR